MRLGVLCACPSVLAREASVFGYFVGGIFIQRSLCGLVRAKSHVFIGHFFLLRVPMILQICFSYGGFFFFLKELDSRERKDQQIKCEIRWATRFISLSTGCVEIIPQKETRKGYGTETRWLGGTVFEKIELDFLANNASDKYWKYFIVYFSEDMRNYPLSARACYSI